MSREITEDELAQIIEYQRGSCHSLCTSVDTITDGEADDDDLTDEQYSKIDDEIFECSVCGWWYETSEQNEVDGENVCSQCFEETDYE